MRETWSEGVARVRAFIEEHRSDRIRLGLHDTGIRFITHKDVLKELEDDRHRWHIIENAWAREVAPQSVPNLFVNRLRIYLWCEWCGVFAEHVSLTLNGDSPGSLFRYRVPGKTNEFSHEKPQCVIRTHPPPSLKINYKEKRNERGQEEESNP